MKLIWYSLYIRGCISFRVPIKINCRHLFTCLCKNNPGFQNEIESFSLSQRKTNDKNNKIRERIICDIINDRVPPEYFNAPEWDSLKTAIHSYLYELNGYTPYSRVECLQKGGRNFNYDFDIIFYISVGDDNTSLSPPPPTKYNVEFKYNILEIAQTPQFVSPIKPSQYLTLSYENYFFENYLSLLSAFSGLQLPSKDVYMKEINHHSPACMKLYQDLYYSGCKASSRFTGDERAIAFYEKSKELSAESIRRFIEMADIKIDELSNYLSESQKNKIYMMYFKEKMILEKTNVDDYRIDPSSCIKNPAKSRYEFTTVSGKPLHILLRWKNGNGIAFPSFQIS